MGIAVCKVVDKTLGPPSTIAVAPLWGWREGCEPCHLLWHRAHAGPEAKDFIRYGVLRTSRAYHIKQCERGRKKPAALRASSLR